MSGSNNDQYAPWRTSIDAMRLSYQHFLWREHLGYNLHPSIKFEEDSGLQIADIATAHCLWALQVGETFGPNTKILASDISIDNSPPAHLLPSCMEVRKWDFFSPAPEEWLGAFDLVHVRLIVAAFKNEKDANKILEKFVSMLSK